MSQEVNGLFPKYGPKRLHSEAVLALFEKYKDRAFYPVFELVTNSTIKEDRGAVDTRVFKKDRNLPLLLHSLLESRTGFPLVDKQSNLVFVPFAHRLIRATLYALYKDLAITEFYDLTQQSAEIAEKYTDEGMGYHYTSMRTPFMPNIGQHPIKGRNYRPDRIDKEAWQMIAGERGTEDF